MIADRIDHGLIMQGWGVRAILEDRKTQTRRVARRVADGLCCPYGQTGDLLWVREKWRFLGVDMNRHGRTHYVEDCVVEYGDETRRTIEVDWQIGEAELLRHNNWRPSIHMPRWASRLTLRITDVRVQRVQEITDKDCMAEGLGMDVVSYGWRPAFARLWDSINAKRGYSWQSNPWVWAISFERVTGRE